MNFDPLLVQRLTRPLKHPGVTNHRMVGGLLERFQALENRLPLLDQQLSRWSTIVELDAEQVPIVYAQSPELDDQVGDNFRGDFVAKKEEVRSPVQKSIKSITNAEIPIVEKSTVEKGSMDVIVSPITTEIDNALDASIIQQETQQEIPSSPIASVEVSSSIPAIASSSVQELSFVQLSPQNSDSPTIAQGLPIASEALPKTSVLPTESIQKEQSLSLNQSSDYLHSPNISTVQPVSDAQPELVQPLVIQSVSEGIIQARHDQVAPSSFYASENATEKATAATELTIASPVNNQIAIEGDTASDVRHMLQQEITSSPIAAVEASVMPLMAITPEKSPAMIGDLDMLILQAQRETGTTLSKMISDSENPKELIKSKSQPTKNNKRSLDSKNLKNADISINQISTPRHPNINNQTLATSVSENKSTSDDFVVNPITTEVASALDVSLVMQEISSDSSNSVVAPVTSIQAIALDTTPITINAVSDPVIQAKEDVSARARSPINPVSESIGFTSVIATSEPELSFVQIPQNLDSSSTDQGAFITSESLPKVSILFKDSPQTLSKESTQKVQPLSYNPDLPQIPIIPISNPLSTLLSEPLSFAPNISSASSENQLSSSQIQQITPVNTEKSEHYQPTVQIVSEAQPELAQPLVIQPVNEGIIQARYDSAAPSIINAQPVIPTIADPWLGSLPEVSEISWTSSSENPQNLMPIVSTDPITLPLPSINTSIESSSVESPTLIKVRKIDAQITQNSPDSLVQKIIQEPIFFEQKLEPTFEPANLEVSTVYPNLATQNIDNPTVVNDTLTYTQAIYPSQDSLVFTPSNPNPVNENIAVAAPITSKTNNPKTNKAPNSSLSNDTQQQINSSPVRVQIVREKVSTSNSSLPLARETAQDSQLKLTSVNDNLDRSSPAQSPVVPTVQAIVEVSEQPFEPLLLSRRSSNATASDMTGNYPNQSHPNSKAIANSNNITTYPTSNSSNQNHLSTQSAPAQSSTVTNPSHQVPSTVVRPQNIPELKESNSANIINMDLLVDQVERKIIKRLIVEGERRGKRKWL